jgi:hypothetical protein
LEKNDGTGLLRLADKTNFGNREMVAHIEALERDIVEYFKSRNEDNTQRSIPVQPPPPIKTKPSVAVKAQPHRGGGVLKTTTFSSNKGRGGIRPPIWSSGPAGTHVDDNYPYLDQCTCPGHHHHPDNHDCPCAPHHTDDQHCWDSTEHHHHNDDHPHHQNDDQHHHHPHNDDQPHHQNDDDHHHHQHQNDDHFGGHHSSHAHEHHGGSGYVDNSGYTYDHSSGGGGFSSTDYGGPGSFY